MIINLQLFAEEGETETESFPLDQSDFTPEDQDLEEESEVNPLSEEDPETVEEEEGTPNPENSPTSEGTLKIKFNHEEKELSYQEAAILAQKGMNYDKLQSKYNEIQNNPGLTYLNELANKNNVSVDELVDYWKNQEYQNELNELIQNNIPEELAQEILENKKFRNQYQRQQEEQQKENSQNQEFREFYEAFPDIKPEEIPQEVWLKQEKGIPLKYAYMEHQREELIKENKILKQNKENKSKAPLGSITANGTNDNTKEDPFLEGFNSAF